MLHNGQYFEPIDYSVADDELTLYFDDRSEILEVSDIVQFTLSRGFELVLCMRDGCHYVLIGKWSDHIFETLKHIFIPTHKRCALQVFKGFRDMVLDMRP